MKKQIATMVLAAMTMTMVSGCGSQKVEGTAAVKVNGDIITQEAIDARYEQTCAIYRLDPADSNVLSLKKTVVEGLIDEKLLLQEADKRGIKADKEEVEALQNQVRGYYSSDEEFEAGLAEQKMTVDQFNTMAEEQVIYTALQDELLKDEPIDAQAYYDEHQAEFAIDERVRASHILVATEEEAQAIIEELNNGADFAELAKEKSNDGAAPNGGDLGYFTKDRMVAEFADAAFSQEVGTYSQVPVQSEFGYHIILVVDKKPAGVQEFAEVEQSITNNLSNAKINELFNTLLDSLRESAEIEYIIPMEEIISAPADDVATDGDQAPADDAANDDTQN